MCSRRQRLAFMYNWYNRRKLCALFAVAAVVFLAYFSLFRRKKNSAIFVVEEHHEALAYWFHAVNEGLVQRQGNVLIHVDGHSDESTPEYVTGMPLFRFPRDDREASYFLQKNDVFIQGAVMAGIVSRVVWVWPSWDKRLLEEKQEYESQLVELGYFWAEGGDAAHQKEPYFCQCELPNAEQDADTRKCSYLNSSAPTADLQFTVMTSGLCQIETSYISEHVNEMHFVDKIKNDDSWISKDASVILDVDEDFFGCESVADSITRDHIPWSLIESIDVQLKSFICPKSIAHEEIGNRFLRKLLEPFLKSCTSQFNKVFCTGEGYLSKLLSDAYDDLVSEFRLHPSLFCGQNDFEVRTVWTKLAEIFHQLPQPHILRLYTLGFCLSTSPKTLFFEDGRVDFVVCHGNNSPNTTIVYLHSPSHEEVIHHSQLFHEMMYRLFQMNPIQLVTLSRSVRDGYTPRGLSDLIEDKILRTFRKVSDGRLEINYDDDLLGGRTGWKSRT